MKRTHIAAALVAALAAGPALAQSQLVATTGLSPEEAAGLTLNQLAAAKYNREVSYADRQAVRIPPAAGPVDRSQLVANARARPGASLNEIAAAKYNREVSYADRQRVRPAGQPEPRRYSLDKTHWHQLVASAGLKRQDAVGLTLNEIAAIKYNREVSYADRQRVRR